MAIVLHHHPWSRAANVVWMLEEVGATYELRWVDIMTGAQKSPELLALNPMGKLPTLVDGGTVVTESAAIGIYLADRYAYGTLAPKVDDPKRATYLRWSFFAPSVIEPASMAKAGNWTLRESQVGWGNYDAVVNAIKTALAGRDFVLGDTFSMADVIFGGTIRYMLMVKGIEPLPELVAYGERLAQRPALQRAEAKNKAIAAEHGLGQG
ncbi:MAG: glutathione S-transferase family protein [Deltaproteobacteria bacterium]|nr:glutathione S-transferase family protein [Deltaproteobacteria bacterium]